jgi:hypothetical protein
MLHSRIVGQIVDSGLKVHDVDDEKLNRLHRCNFLSILFRQGQRELEHPLLVDGEEFLGPKELGLSQHAKVPLCLRNA